MNIKKINFMIKKYLFIFIFGALTYMSIELITRQRTHWAMGLLGGIALILIGILNEFHTVKIPVIIQATIGSIIITLLEYTAGYILNIKLHLNIWDYSMLPFNINGQVCLYFSLIWIVLSFAGIYLDDFIRCKIFNEPKKNMILGFKWRKK